MRVGNNTNSFKRKKFYEAAKLGKVSEDAYNQRGWLILKELLNKWVDEGIASNPHDFNVCNVCTI